MGGPTLATRPSKRNTYGVAVECPDGILTCMGPSESVSKMSPGLFDMNGNVIGDPFALCGFPQ